MSLSRIHRHADAARAWLHAHVRRVDKLAPGHVHAHRAGPGRTLPARGRAPFWTGLAAVAACAAGLLVWAGAPQPGPPPAAVKPSAGRMSEAQPTAPAAPARPADSPAASPKPTASRIAPQAPDLGPYLIRPPFIILDGVTFGPEQARPTRLAGLVAPPATAVCFDRTGQLWACGLQARAALSRLISKRDVECVPTGATADLVEATCRIEDLDLGRSLLEQGFARAARPDGPFAAAEGAARRAEVGLWNGGWRLR